MRQIIVLTDEEITQLTNGEEVCFEMDSTNIRTTNFVICNEECFAKMININANRNYTEDKK